MCICPACSVEVEADSYEDTYDACGQIVHDACEDWCTYDIVVCHWCLKDAES